MGMIHQRLEEMHANAKVCEAPPFPKTLLLEPTNHCNLHCSFCENRSSTVKKTMMAIETAERLLTEGYAAGAREVGFYLRGEPLLNPDLPEMVSRAKTIGYSYIYITTNGVLATPALMEELIARGMDSVKFSLNAGTREEYIAIHGLDAFDTVMHNLDACIAMRHSAESAKNHLRRLFASCIYVKTPSAGQVALRERVGPLVEDFIFSEENLFVRSVGGRSCLFPFERIHVSADGYVQVCCIDHHNNLIIGDSSQQELADIWNGATFREFRKNFMANKLDGTLCGYCQYGCRDKIVPLPIPTTLRSTDAV